MAACNNPAVENSCENVFQLPGEKELATAKGQATHDTVTDLKPGQVAGFSGANHTEEELY